MIAKQPTQTAKKIAQQIAREPLEILKTAGEQTFGAESSGQPEVTSGREDNQKKQIDEQQKLQDKLKATRQVEALNRELEDIRKQDLFKDLQRRISEGEEIPLENYPELSPEQKQVLRAQMEAVKTSKHQTTEESDGLVEPAAKKGRQLFNFGKKTAVKREQTHVEKPVPPSG